MREIRTIQVTDADVRLDLFRTGASVLLAEILLTMMAQRDVQEEYLRLRGQMLYVHEWRAIIYLATPV